MKQATSQPRGTVPSSDAAAEAREPGLDLPPLTNPREAEKRIAELERALAEAREYLKSSEEPKEAKEVKVESNDGEKLLRAVPVPFLVLEPDLRVRTASESFYQTFQLTPAETEGRVIYEISHGKWNIPGLRKLLDEVILRNHACNNIEVTHEFDVIGPRTMLLNARRTDKEAGMTEHILLAIEDITERKQAEELLRRHHDTFFNLIENAPFGVYVVDEDFRMRQVSAGSAKAFANVRPLIGRDFAEVMHILWPEGFATEAIMRFRHTLKTGEPYVAAPLTEQRADVGEVESYDWKIERVMLPDGQWGVVCYYYDVTEQKRAEDALRTSEAQFRFVTDHVPVMILHCDAEARYTFVNAPYAARFHLRPENVVGRAIREVLGPEAYELIREHVETALRGENVEFEAQVPNSTRWLHCMYVPERAADGKVRGFVAVMQDITARKRAVEKVRESERLYRAIGESINYGVWTCDVAGRNTYVSESFLKLVGITQEQCSNFGWTELLHPDDVEHTLAAWKECVRTQGNWDMEHRFRGVDGQWHAMLARGVAVRNEEGVLTGWAGINLDITGLKEAQQALRDSEARMRLATEATAVGIWEWNVVTNQLVWDAELFRMYGIEPTPGGVLTYDDWKQAVLPGDLAAQEALLKDTVQHGGKNRGEFRIRRRDNGECRDIEAVETARKNERGEVEWVVGTNLDITERKRTSEALEDGAARFRALADNIAQLAWMAEPDGTLIWFNQRWFDYTGTTYEEMKIAGRQRLHHPDYLEKVTQKWQQHLVTGTIWEDTFPLRGVDGNFRWFLSRAIPIRDESGKVVRWFGTNTDVTEQRAATEALTLAKEQVEVASRAKDDFLAALSHELRTPLTPVLMTAEALQEDPDLPQDVREQLAMIFRNITLEARLIDDLLDITRISRGTLHVAPVTADVHALLDHTDEIIRADALIKDVGILFELTATQRHALVDPTRMQQVFWNVLKNAVKFSPAGGSITVSTHNDHGGRIVVSFKDDGIGIDAAALPHIFKAFEQGDIAGQHRYGGLGLGLAISHAIMEAHGGSIQAESAGVGQGTTFTVVLDTTEEPARVDQAHPPQAAESRALRLLTVDDHEPTRNVLVKLLTRSGHHVVSASTVEEALAAAAAQRFDVVISDLGLPDGSGMDLMREIKRLYQCHGIALSGYGMEEDLRQSQEAGFSAHLVKPVDYAQLRLYLMQIEVP